MTELYVIFSFLGHSHRLLDTDHYKFRTILLNVNFLSISDLRFCLACAAHFILHKWKHSWLNRIYCLKKNCDHLKPRNLFIITSISACLDRKEAETIHACLALEFHWEKCMAINLWGEVVTICEPFQFTYRLL